MPSRLFIIVREARKLPAIDRKRKTTDWYAIFTTCLYSLVLLIFRGEMSTTIQK